MSEKLEWVRSTTRRTSFSFIVALWFFIFPFTLILIGPRVSYLEKGLALYVDFLLSPTIPFIPEDWKALTWVLLIAFVFLIVTVLVGSYLFSLSAAGKGGKNQTYEEPPNDEKKEGKKGLTWENTSIFVYQRCKRMWDIFLRYFSISTILWFILWIHFSSLSRSLDGDGSGVLGVGSCGFISSSHSVTAGTAIMPIVESPKFSNYLSTFLREDDGGVVFVLGPSGVGKSLVVHRSLQNFVNNVNLIKNRNETSFSEECTKQKVKPKKVYPFCLNFKKDFSEVDVVKRMKNTFVELLSPGFVMNLRMNSLTLLYQLLGEDGASTSSSNVTDSAGDKSSTPTKKAETPGEKKGNDAANSDDGVKTADTASLIASISKNESRFEKVAKQAATYWDFGFGTGNTIGRFVSGWVGNFALLLDVVNAMGSPFFSTDKPLEWLLRVDKLKEMYHMYIVSKFSGNTFGGGLMSIMRFLDEVAQFEREDKVVVLYINEFQRLREIGILEEALKYIRSRKSGGMKIIVDTSDSFWQDGYMMSDLDVFVHTGFEKNDAEEALKAVYTVDAFEAAWDVLGGSGTYHAKLFRCVTRKNKKLRECLSGTGSACKANFQNVNACTNFFEKTRLEDLKKTINELDSTMEIGSITGVILLNETLKGVVDYHNLNGSKKKVAQELIKKSFLFLDISRNSSGNLVSQDIITRTAIETFLKEFDGDARFVKFVYDEKENKRLADAQAEKMKRLGERIMAFRVDESEKELKKIDKMTFDELKSEWNSNWEVVNRN